MGNVPSVRVFQKLGLQQPGFQSRFSRERPSNSPFQFKTANSWDAESAGNHDASDMHDQFHRDCGQSMKNNE